MEWVVQSAEKRNHEDETPYLIDMDDMNTTATKVCDLFQITHPLTDIPATQIDAAQTHVGWDG